MMSRIKILALMKLWEINSRSSEIYDKLIIHNLSDQFAINTRISGFTKAIYSRFWHIHFNFF